MKLLFYLLNKISITFYSSLSPPSPLLNTFEKCSLKFKVHVMLMEKRKIKSLTKKNKSVVKTHAFDYHESCPFPKLNFL